MLHPYSLSRLHPAMKRRANAQRRPRPKLPRIPEEMRQWSDLLLQEVLGLAGRQFPATFGRRHYVLEKSQRTALRRARNREYSGVLRAG
jgi:hypothetical protein